MSSASLASLKLPEIKRSNGPPVKPQRRNTSQHLRRMAYWNKLKQDNIERQLKQKSSKQLRRRNSANDIPYQEPYFCRNRWEDFRNAAHPRKAKFITTIQGAFLPTIFDENLASLPAVQHGGSGTAPAAITGASNNICLNDILMFDQQKHNRDIDKRNTVLEQLASRSGSPFLTQSLAEGNLHYQAGPTGDQPKANNAMGKSMSAPVTPGFANKVTFDPRPVYERQTMPTWKTSLKTMIDELGVKMELNIEASDDCTDPNDVTTSIKQTTRTGTASSICHSLIDSGLGLSTANSSRPVSVLEVLSKCEDSVKLAQIRKNREARSKSGHSGNSFRTLGSQRPSTAATITEESIKELDEEGHGSVASKADIESSIIKRITKTVNNLEFTEDMLMYLLCQIFQTTHEKVVHEWLESASSTDKDYVIGLLKTALGN